VARVHRRSLDDPEERIGLPGITEELVDIGGLTVGRSVQQPGWRWSKDVRPVVGGEWCQAHHIGIVLSGRYAVEMEDGTTVEFGPNDVYDIPPGHDGYTVGDEPCVLVEWSGLRTLAGSHAVSRGRILATLLFTDLVDSTGTAVRLGDAAWRDVLAAHYAAARSQLERLGGREVKTTGDGLLAIFEGPAAALRCAAGIRSSSGHAGLHIRAGVHVGEIQLAGSDVQGVAVHEAARIMAQAGKDEILLSEITRQLAEAAGLRFEDRGTHELKGIPGPRRLYAYVEG
jgi:class 3 adenylate cyclase